MKINVLVFPAGEINSIELHDALASCVNVKLYGASSIDRHGSYVFENYISGLPLITDSSFIDRFNELIENYQIDVVFPTHDTVAAFLSANEHRIATKIIAADRQTCLICRDKLKTYETFSSCDFVPKLYKEIESFPVFIKPREGQGSVGAKLIEKQSDIPDVDLSTFVITEYLPGKECTVDCFTDNSGALRYVSPRLRKRVMAGVSASGEIMEPSIEIQQIAQEINNKLKFFGLWWFQLKQDSSNRWKLLEISTRCAGSMALTRARGVNLPLLSVYTAVGYDISVEENEYHVAMDSTLIRRYKIDYDYDKVYFDFDDTLTLRGKVNLKAIYFLYQCQNYGKKVILLTKHEGEIYDTMNKLHVHPRVFHKIIHLKQHEKKSDYIDPLKTIFIDNSFQERNEVKNKHNIPVFDVDGLDFLMDWRY